LNLEIAELEYRQLERQAAGPQAIDADFVLVFRSGKQLQEDFCASDDRACVDFALRIRLHQ
jgi:hypothetical protein